VRHVRAILATIALLSAALSAEPVSQLHPTNYVNDFARVLDSNTTTELNDVCRQLDQKTQAKVAVVTINSTDSDSIEDYAVALFKQWGLGTKETNRGVLVLLAVKDRKYRTEVGYGLEPILPDGKVGGFWREAVPLLKQSDYSGAVKLTTERVAEVIANDAGIQLTGTHPPPQGDERPQIPLSAIVAFVVIAIIVLATPLRRVLFWWLLFNSGSRWGGGYRSGGWGSGGWGGGGFGGGGGGFGGFGGGGSSGGGGASGGW
jgi:uncharacterized protein